MLCRGSISLLCALALWLGGCAKRQDTRSIVVYIPAHAPAPAAAAAPAPGPAPAAAEPQILVIEEPAPPPEPEVTPQPQTPGSSKNNAGGKKGGGRPARTETPSEPDETSTQENSETPPAEVPPLEPRQSSAQQTELRRQFLQLEHDIHQRLTRLNGAQLSANDQKTLEDARTFFAQATHAMATGDLPRALNLARKASLLLAALE